MSELTELIPPLLELCAEAALAICQQYNSAAADRFEYKSDSSPLTQADLDSHAILRSGLERLLPGVPVLSEESSPGELSDRRQWSSYWLVDPLDGTREFLGRTGEFTINIALIENHRPVLGVLYLPLEMTGYVGIPGQGAWRYSTKAPSGEGIAVRALRPGRPMTVISSRRHKGERLQACLDWLEREWGSIETVSSGSALKFCRLAEGRADFYPRFSPCSEWDTAAGQALLEAAGGGLIGLEGAPLRYNCRDELLSPNFFAVADPGNAIWRKMLAWGME